MKQVERVPSQYLSTAVRWRGYFVDSLLAMVGVALVTAIIAVTHLYPQIPTILFVYLLVVLALASTRGLFGAILASVLSVLAFDFFLIAPTYTFVVITIEDLMTLVVFLAMAIITGQLAALLRRRVEEARSRERELRVLYEQAKELAAFQERQRLARELHDSVSQALYAIGLGAQAAHAALERGEREQAIASTEYVSTLAEAGLAEMRALIFELRPESLATEGLVAALQRQVSVLRARYRLTVEAELADEPDVSLEVKQALYRITQEAFHNIVKHARAKTVVIQLVQQKHEITLEVRDDGKGFDLAGAFPGHFGLRSMEERAAQMHGNFTINSGPGEGTCICVSVPH